MTARTFVGKVLCVALCEDSNVVFSGGEDRTLRAWNPRNGLPLGDPVSHQGEVTCCHVARASPIALVQRALFDFILTGFIFLC